jgi:sialate O-acetylesterase
MNKRMVRITLSFVSFIFIVSNLAAGIVLPKIIASNMVLQRDMLVPIWGKALPGEKITVSFSGQNKETIADASGCWKVILDPMPASDKPVKMVVCGSDTIKLDNILVGEVWLCSGQSNMEYPMDRRLKKYTAPLKGTDVAEEIIKNPNNPEIRLFLVEKVQNVNEVVTKKGWQESSDSSIRAISAAGYFFINEIQKELNVPVGLISSSWGGSRIEPWTPQNAYMESSLFKPDTTKTYQIDGSKVGNMWNSMIKPMVPFAVKGFIWYQGESNCMINDGLRYADKFELMVNAWRKEWNKADLPFYFVQISPYYYTKRKDKKPHTNETLAEFWEAQTKTLAIPYTGMIVTTDLVDDLSNIHPSYKWEVGRRLSLLAMANTYNKKGLVTSGPVFRKMVLKGNKAILQFTNTGSELVSKDGKPLTWFAIAGADGHYVPADAVIKKNTVIVSNINITKPQTVRFAWDETAMPNLFNKEGLPAVPFRTNSPEWNITIK